MPSVAHTSPSKATSKALVPAAPGPFDGEDAEPQARCVGIIWVFKPLVTQVIAISMPGNWADRPFVSMLISYLVS